MKKKPQSPTICHPTKLDLARETVRSLSEVELRVAAGGRATKTNFQAGCV